MRSTLATTILTAVLAAAGTAQQRDGRAARQLNKLLEGVEAEHRKAITSWFAKLETSREQRDAEQRSDVEKLRTQIEAVRVENSKLRARLEEEAGRTESVLERIRAETAKTAATNRDLIKLIGRQSAVLAEIADRVREDAKKRAADKSTSSRRLEMLLNEVIALRAVSRDDRRSGARASVDPAPEAPAGLGRSVSRLGSSDAGTRFSALDALLQNADPKVVEHVAPMLEDADAFVRRLAAEGLGRFRSKSAVDALVPALDDAEPIVRQATHASLLRLTGEDVDFEPDATPQIRAAGTARWKKWWAKHRARFSNNEK